MKKTLHYHLVPVDPKTSCFDFCEGFQIIITTLSQGIRPLVWQALAAAGEALAAIGQEKPSLEMFTAAQAIVIEIADQIGDADLRLAYRRDALAKIWG